MNNHLFVYGSLMPQLTTAFGRDERERLQRESQITGPGIVVGRLFDLGEYPGLCLSSEGNGPQDVHGVLLSLSAPAQTFAWLDHFEDIVPGRASEFNLYARIEAQVRLASQSQWAWVYVLARAPDNATEIASGRWRGT